MNRSSDRVRCRGITPAACACKVLSAAGGGFAAFTASGAATGAGITGVGAGAGGKGGNTKVGQGAAVVGGCNIRP